jgi:hypothetical protein
MHPLHGQLTLEKLPSPLLSFCSPCDSVMLTGSPLFADELPLTRNAAATPVCTVALTLPTDSDLHSTSASPESLRMFKVSILRPPRALARLANRRSRKPATALLCSVPLCHHSCGHACCKPFSVQPIGGMCARVDGKASSPETSPAVSSIVGVVPNSL